MTIKIKITNTDGVNFSSYLADFDANFDRGDSRGSFNDTMFSGDEYVLSENGDLTADPAYRGVIANGDMSYDIATHTVAGSIDSFDFGHGAKQQGGGFSFAQADLTISGLSLKDADVDKQLGALMENDTKPLKASLAGDSISFSGSAGADRFTGYGKGDTLSGGGGNDVLKGAGGKDVLKGGAGNDTLSGGDGNDTIHGGTGKDTLKGGAGDDVFVFDTAPKKSNVDTISDFSIKHDTIWIDNADFKGIANGHLSKAAFVIGTEAKDGSDRIIYDSKTGDLFYDRDGQGGAHQVQFASLDDHLKLTAADFLVL